MLYKEEKKINLETYPILKKEFLLKNGNSLKQKKRRTICTPFLFL